jgi:hypothetical protein
MMPDGLKADLDRGFAALKAAGQDAIPSNDLRPSWHSGG